VTISVWRGGGIVFYRVLLPWSVVCDVHCDHVAGATSGKGFLCVFVVLVFEEKIKVTMAW